jgi:hypothetical protein
MSKTIRSNQQHFAASPAPESGKHYPRLEEIKRSLFPLLVGAEPTRQSDPRFADMVERFVVRRSA